MIAAIVCSLLLLGPSQERSPIAFEGAVPGSADGSVDHHQRLRLRRPLGPQVELPLADPISPGELERWAWLLELSDAQRLFIRDQYAGYLRSEDEFFLTHVKPLYDDSVSILETRERNGGDLASIAVPLNELMARVPRVDRRAWALEVAFFRHIENCLSDVQRPRLDGVQSERRRLRVRFYSRIPASEIDLVEMLHELATEGWDVPPASSHPLGSLMEQYDRRLREPCRWRYEHSMDIVARGMMAKADKRAGTLSPLVDEIGRVRENLGAAESEILAANESFLRQFVTALPSDVGDALLNRYRQTAYPSVYPDPTDIDPVFVQLKEIQLPGNARAAIREARDTYAAQRCAIDQRMTGAFSQWRTDITANGGPLSLDRSRQFGAAMHELHEMRLANARMTLETLRSQTPATMDAAHVMLRAWSDTLDAVTFEPDPAYCIHTD